MNIIETRLYSSKNLDDIKHLTEKNHILNVDLELVYSVYRQPFKTALCECSNASRSEMIFHEVEYKDSRGNALDIIEHTFNGKSFWQMYNEHLSRKQFFDDKYVTEYKFGYITGTSHPMLPVVPLQGMTSTNNVPGYNFWQRAIIFKEVENVNTTN